MKVNKGFFSFEYLSATNPRPYPKDIHTHIHTWGLNNLYVQYSIWAHLCVQNISDSKKKKKRKKQQQQQHIPCIDTHKS